VLNASKVAGLRLDKWRIYLTRNPKIMNFKFVLSFTMGIFFLAKFVLNVKI